MKRATGLCFLTMMLLGLPLAGIVSAGALNILIPDAAFIAVENRAQQQALKDAERKSLSSHAALEFDEFNEVDSPEPGTILMVVLSLPWLLWMQKRKCAPPQLEQRRISGRSI